ncbi:MAG: hypothetical protein ABI120_16855, partial [Gemmatimonadaceae bacterium]
MTSRTRATRTRTYATTLLLLAIPSSLSAQDRLKTMPGYEQFAKMQAAMQGGVPVKSGAVNATWSADGKSFDFTMDGTRKRFDVATKKISSAGDAPATAGRGGRGGGGPERGRQFESALSPDSTLKALYRDRNMFVSSANGSNEQRITSDGSMEKRIKYGTA